MKHISRVVLASFWYLNIHPTAEAIQTPLSFWQQSQPDVLLRLTMGMNPHVLGPQKERPLALEVLHRISTKEADPVYQRKNLFNFLSPSKLQQNIRFFPEAENLNKDIEGEEEDDYETEESEDDDFTSGIFEGKSRLTSATPLIQEEASQPSEPLPPPAPPENKTPKQVYKGHIDALGAFAISEDGSMRFHGDPNQCLDSIAFETEKTLILDKINAKNVLLASSCAVLKDKATIENLTLQLKGENAAFAIEKDGVLRTRILNLQGRHFWNGGVVELPENGTIKIENGALYNRGTIRTPKAEAPNAAFGTIEAPNLALEANNALNRGHIKGRHIKATVWGHFDHSGQIEAVDEFTLEAQTYTQTGMIEANKATLNADTHSLQGEFKVPNLHIQGDTKIEILAPLHTEALRFSGSGTLINRAGIEGERDLVLETAKTENNAPILANETLRLAHHIVNNQTIVGRGRTAISDGSVLHNGAADNKEAVLTFSHVVFEGAQTTVQNFGTFVATETNGPLRSLDLRAGSRWGMGAAHVTVETLKHAGILTFASGTVALQRNALLKTQLLELESEQATLHAQQDLTLHASSENPQQSVLWQQKGVVKAKTLTLEGAPLTLQGGGSFHAENFVANVSKVILLSQMSGGKSKRLYTPALRVLGC